MIHSFGETDHIAVLEPCVDKTRAVKKGIMQYLLTGRVRLVKPESFEDV